MSEKKQQVITQEEQRAAGRFLISLLKSSLHRVPAERKPEEWSWDVVWRLAKRNNVENTVSPAISRSTGEISETMAKKWKLSQSQILHRLLQFEVERETILKEMDRQGISYLPLKGILLAEYYPEPGMRWMCDNDILYGRLAKKEDGTLYMPKEAEQPVREKLYEIMKSLGYTAEYLGGNHDVYQKKPFFNFEMHQRLVSSESELAEYYQNPWKRAVPVAGKAFQYHFSDEDEYLFMTAHAYKHFHISGCGIRTLVDEYVFLQKKQDMDWNYIQNELGKMHITEFEQKLRETAQHAFSADGILTQDEWELIFCMMGSGTYGTLQNRIHGQMKCLQEDSDRNWKIRMKYIWQRVWTDEARMKEYYSFFYRHKWSRIGLPLYRLVKGMCIHPGMLIAEWKEVNGYRREEKQDESKRRIRNERSCR